MADPMLTLDGTETGPVWREKINDNTTKRQWLDLATVTSAGSPYTVTSANEMIRADATSGAITINLPAVASSDGMRFWIEAVNVANTITVDGNASETIDGATTKVLGTAGRLTEFYCTGSAWETWSKDQTISGGGDALVANPLSQFAATTSSQLAGVISDETGSGALVFGTSPTFTTDITVPNTGLHVLDTNASHDLILKPGSDLTADRTLTLTTGDADRTLTLSADATVSGTNTGDQTSVSGNAGTATALQTARTINGVSFDGTANITVTAAGSTLSDTVTIAKGGTGQTAQTAAMDALSPTTTKGDLLVDDGTNVVRLAVGSNGAQLVASSGATPGVKWAAKATLRVPFSTRGDAQITWTDMPAAEAFLFGSTRAVTKVDLTEYTECRLQLNKLGTVGATGSKLSLKYATSGPTTLGNYAAIGTSAVEVVCDATDVNVSSWIALAAGAKADVFVAVTGQGGDGVVDAQFGAIVAEFR